MKKSVFKQDTENLYQKLFTGFNDKEGKELYEGDIVTFKYKNLNNHLDKQQLVKCVIVWNIKGMWSLKWSDGYINNNTLNPERYIKIGNVYDNAELMNKI